MLSYAPFAAVIRRLVTVARLLKAINRTRQPERKGSGIRQAKILRLAKKVQERKYNQRRKGRRKICMGKEDYKVLAL